MSIQVTTNHKPRWLVRKVDLPEKVQSDFDYVKDDWLYRFVQYKGAWYDVDDTQSIQVTSEHHRPMGWAMYVEPGHPFAPYTAVLSETYFSGVLFKLVDDDKVVCANYFS